MRPPARRTAWVLLAVILVVQGVLLVWHRGHDSAQPHELPVVVQGPSVVASGVADRLNRLPQRPVTAVVVDEDADARDDVRDGRAVAAVVIDLRKADDVLYVSTVNDAETTRLASTLAKRVATPMGRTSVTREVAPAEHPDVSRSTVGLASGLWVAAGFLVGVGWALLRWRRRTSSAPGARSVVLAVATCAAASLLVALVFPAGAFLSWWALGFASTSAAALSTIALEVVLGPVGLALASTFFLFLAGPLLSGRDPRLLPGFWWEVAPWTLHGATRELASAMAWFGSASVLRPVLVLVAFLVVPLVALAATARLRAPEEQDSGRPLGAVSWRLRVVALTVPVAVVLVAATLLAPAGAKVVSAEPVPGASRTSCVATPEVTNLKQLNAFAGKLRGGEAFQGADVGADVLLQDGRRLWVFGDTLRAADFPGQRFVRNSMLVLGEGCAQTVVPADDGALIPDRGDGVGYWPMSIARVQRPGYDLVGVAAQRVRTTNEPDGAFAFESLGSSMAVFVVLRGGTPQLVAQQDVGPDDKDTARPQWGAAAAVHGGWVYLYGTARPQEQGVFGFSLRVARARPDHILERTSWQFWDGSRWQAKADQAKELIAADQGVSQTLSVFPRNGRWYAVSKRDEFLGTSSWCGRHPRRPVRSTAAPRWASCRRT